MRIIASVLACARHQKVTMLLCSSLMRQIRIFDIRLGYQTLILALRLSAVYILSTCSPYASFTTWMHSRDTGISVGQRRNAR